MRGRAAGVLAGVLLAAGLFGAATTARAEAPPLTFLGPERFTDQPPGIRYGGLLYHPSIAAGTIWDSNVFSSNQNLIGDRIDFIRPGLTVSTLDPDRKFTFRTVIDHLEYHNVPSESRTDPRAELLGTLRLQRDFEVDLGLAAGRVHEPRSIQRRDIPEDAAEPVPHNQYAARFAVRRIFNRLVSTTTVAYENDNYFNVRSNSGSTLNLQFLDREVVKAGHETELNLSHRLKLFSRQRAIASDYRQEAGFEERDSVKFETQNGVEVAVTPLIKVRLSHLYGNEHFKVDTIPSEPENIVATEVTWSPRRNIKLTAGVAREFGGVNFDLDSAGGRRTRANVGVDYEISRRLLLRAAFTYLHANEVGIASGFERIEDTYLYRASLSYQLNRYWNLFLDYGFEQRRSTDSDSVFDRHIVQAGAAARF